MAIATLIQERHEVLEVRARDLGRHLPHVPEAGEGLLLSVFTVYHAYFHRMGSRVQKIGTALKKPGAASSAGLH